MTFFAGLRKHECPYCRSHVYVYTADEGTSSYQPLTGLLLDVAEAADDYTDLVAAAAGSADTDAAWDVLVARLSALRVAAGEPE